MQYTYNFQLDVNNRAMEKIAGIGDTLMGVAKGLAPMAGGAIAGGIGGYLGHKLNDIGNGAYEAIDPEFAKTLKTDEASRATAAVRGALMGALSGTMGGLAQSQSMLGALGAGAAAGALPGALTGMLSPLPDEQALINKRIDRSQELDDQILDYYNANGRMPEGLEQFE